MDVNKKILEAIKKARINKGLTQKDVANRIKTTSQYYGKIESGKNLINIERLLEICNVLEISLIKLLRDLKISDDVEFDTLQDEIKNINQELKDKKLILKLMVNELTSILIQYGSEFNFFSKYTNKAHKFIIDNIELNESNRTLLTYIEEMNNSIERLKKIEELRRNTDSFFDLYL